MSGDCGMGGSRSSITWKVIDAPRVFEYVEDDYDSEFLHRGMPLDALQTLDRAETVFYVGTFSKSMFPELRFGFGVVPRWTRYALTPNSSTTGTAR